DVLQLELPVGFGIACVVPGVLGTQARKLARIPVEHERDARGIRSFEERERSRRQQAVIDEANVRRAGVERVVAGTDPPAWHELVDALHVPARLLRIVVSAQREVVDVEAEMAGLLPGTVF